jgi:hypothetical protein
MHWFDTALAAQKVLEETNANIRASAVKIYDDLWSYILEDIEYVKSKSVVIITNGVPLDHVVTMPGSQERGFRLTLDPDKRGITVSGALSMKLVLGAKGNSICLKDDQGNEIKYPAAARKILRQFLFPNLPITSADNLNSWSQQEGVL